MPHDPSPAEPLSERDRAFLREVAEGRWALGAPGVEARLEELAGRADEHADPATRALVAAAVERFEDGVLVLADAVLSRFENPGDGRSGLGPIRGEGDPDAQAQGPHSLGDADRTFLEGVRDGTTDPADASVLPRLQGLVARAEGTASDASRRLLEAALTAHRAALVAAMRQALGPAAPDR